MFGSFTSTRPPFWHVQTEGVTVWNSPARLRDTLATSSAPWKLVGKPREEGAHPVEALSSRSTKNTYSFAASEGIGPTTLSNNAVVWLAGSSDTWARTIWTSAG